MKRTVCTINTIRYTPLRTQIPESHILNHKCWQEQSELVARIGLWYADILPHPSTNTIAMLTIYTAWKTAWSIIVTTLQQLESWHARQMIQIFSRCSHRGSVPHASTTTSSTSAASCLTWKSLQGLTKQSSVYRKHILKSMSHEVNPRWGFYTPWKINMEPTNHPLRKENDLPNFHDYVPC